MIKSTTINSTLHLMLNHNSYCFQTKKKNWSVFVHIFMLMNIIFITSLNWSDNQHFFTKCAHTHTSERMNEKEAIIIDWYYWVREKFFELKLIDRVAVTSIYRLSTFIIGAPTLFFHSLSSLDVQGNENFNDITVSCAKLLSKSVIKIRIEWRAMCVCVCTCDWCTWSE